MSDAQDITIPTLVTERLILRPHRLDDFGASAALWADPAVVRFIGGVPFNREQSWSRLLRYKGSWHFLGFGFWAVEERQSGDFVGEVGFLEGRRAMTPSIEGTLETGWVLSPSAHGKGYATEALTAVVAWGQARFPDQRMTCIIATENSASLRVAAKLGFDEVTRTTYNESAIALLERNGRG
jgi:RimJ/RimL family protein N-acetyltransferase